MTLDKDAYRRATVRRLAVTVGASLWRRTTGTDLKFRGGTPLHRPDGDRLVLDEDEVDLHYEPQEDPEVRVQSDDEGLIRRRRR